ncbi:MAG: ABC transporter substrate-binding protein [Acidimicrobiales bacterium]
MADSDTGGSTAATVDPNGTSTPGTGDGNSASFRGVTADTIKVGITVPDFEALQARGLTNYQGSNRIAFSVFIDKINAEGGIHGRMIEPVFADFDFLQPATQDTACAQLTDDEEVFIVLYGLLAASNLCLTELHQTMVMTNSFQNRADRERSGDTLWLQLEAEDDATVEILGSVMAETGLLDGATIAILANGVLSDGAAGTTLQATLADLGYDAGLDIIQAAADDQAAADRELAVIAEKYKSDGIDFMFNLLGGGDGTSKLAPFGFRPEHIAFRR